MINMIMHQSWVFLFQKTYSKKYLNNFFMIERRDMTFPWLRSQCFVFLWTIFFTSTFNAVILADAKQGNFVQQTVLASSWVVLISREQFIDTVRVGVTVCETRLQNKLCLFLHKGTDNWTNIFFITDIHVSISMHFYYRHTDKVYGPTLLATYQAR